MLEEARDIAARRRWRVHAGSCTATHLHLIVSWRPEDIPDRDVQRLRKSRQRGRADPSTGSPTGPPTRDEQADTVAWKLKDLLGMLLSRCEGTTGNRWFSRGDHDRWVRDQEHLTYLRTEYLPRHRREGGLIRDFDVEAKQGSRG